MNQFWCLKLCFPCSTLIIIKTMLSFIHHILQSFSMSSPHPEGDLQGNLSIELLESLEERVEGQPQEDNSLVGIPSSSRSY